MAPEIYWVRDIEPLRLAIMPRPRAGDWLPDEVAGWHSSGVSIVVSLLEDHEARELDLLNEQKLCEEQGINFISYPISDRGVPNSHQEARELVQALIGQLRSGAALAIHCRAGIGRSSLIAGCVLSLLGITPDEAFRMLSRARGTQVPDTQTQKEWLAMFSHALAATPHDLLE